MLRFYPWHPNKEFLKQSSSSVVYPLSSMVDDSWLDMIWKFNRFMSVMWGMDHVWQGCWSSKRPHHDHKLHPRDDQLLPLILIKPRTWTMLLISIIMVQGWWCMYRYDIPPFSECYMRKCSTSDRLGSSHRPWHDPQLHPRHTQLLP